MSEVRGDDKRNYPMSEVGGGCREEISHTPSPRPGQQVGGATPHLQARGQGQRRGGATTRPRPGAVARRTNLTSKELWLRGCRRA